MVNDHIPATRCALERYTARRGTVNSGGIIKIDDIPHKGSIFLYVPYQAGAKVVLPHRVVRFYMLTDAV
jgi:hypothetical protein